MHRGCATKRGWSRSVPTCGVDSAGSLHPAVDPNPPASSDSGASDRPPGGGRSMTGALGFQPGVLVLVEVTAQAVVSCREWPGKDPREPSSLYLTAGGRLAKRGQTRFKLQNAVLGGVTFLVVVLLIIRTSKDDQHPVVLSVFTTRLKAGAQGQRVHRQPSERTGGYAGSCPPRTATPGLDTRKLGSQHSFNRYISKYSSHSTKPCRRRGSGLWAPR